MPSNSNQKQISSNSDPVREDLSPYLPVTREECVERGWLPEQGQAFDASMHGVDFVFEIFAQNPTSQTVRSSVQHRLSGDLEIWRLSL